MLAVYGPSGELLTCCELKSLHEENATFGFGKITYVAVTSLQFIVCVIIILLYSTSFCDVSKATGGVKVALRRLAGPALLVFVLLIVFFCLASNFEWSYYRLASGNLLKIYGISDISSKCIKTAMIFSRCEFEAASMFPVLVAVVTVIILVAYMQLRIRLLIDFEDQEDDGRFSECFRSIMGCLPMCSCVLVTAVISSAVWFHLPVKIFGNGINEHQRSALQKLQNYGDEMTLFLGMTYTLTALVVIAWPIWRLARRARAPGRTFQSVSAWDSTNQNILLFVNKIIAVLAPLISSLVYNWLEGSS